MKTFVPGLLVVLAFLGCSLTFGFRFEKPEEADAEKRVQEQHQNVEVEVTPGGLVENVEDISADENVEGVTYTVKYCYLDASKQAQYKKWKVTGALSITFATFKQDIVKHFGLATNTVLTVTYQGKSFQDKDKMDNSKIFTDKSMFEAYIGKTNICPQKGGGNPTPAPAPAPTPAPAPAPTPAPAPQPTPEPLPSPQPQPDPVPSPTPEPTPEDVPSPSPEPEDVPSPSPEPTPEDVPSPSPEPEDEPSPSPSPEPEDVPSPSPEPEDEPSPSPSPEPEDVPSPSPEPEDEPSPSPSPELEDVPSPSPEPEDEPSPSPSPEPEDVPSPSPEPEDVPSPSPEPTPEDEEEKDPDAVLMTVVGLDGETEYPIEMKKGDGVADLFVKVAAVTGVEAGSFGLGGPDGDLSPEGTVDDLEGQKLIMIDPVELSPIDNKDGETTDLDNEDEADTKVSAGDDDGVDVNPQRKKEASPEDNDDIKGGGDVGPQSDDDQISVCDDKLQMMVFNSKCRDEGSDNPADGISLTELACIFKASDKDGNGRLTVDELNAGLMSLQNE